jgi:hypothetical protein
MCWALLASGYSPNIKFTFRLQIAVESLFGLTQTLLSEFKI